jgi:hypothetical protein
MTLWSIFAGAGGLLVSRLAMAYLARPDSKRPPELYWFLGIAGLLPAWLTAFMSLLTLASGPRPEKILTAAWVLSSSAVLLGAILTDAVLRRLRESGRDYTPPTYWGLGVLALVPAWGIALLALLLKSPGR